MKRTVQALVMVLVFVIAACTDAHAKPTYTTVIIDYIGKTDRPVFPVIISSSADEAKWYKEKLFIDPVAAFAARYIVRESTMKAITGIPLPKSGSKRQDTDDRSRTSPALELVIANRHDFQEVTLEVADSVSFLSEFKKRVSQYPPLIERLSDIEGRMIRYLKQTR